MNRLFVADFETTVFQGQKFTEVWASAIVELYTENVVIHNSIDSFFEYVCSLQTNCIIWFHNLKFDGDFLLNYLFDIGYKQGIKGEYPNEKLKKEWELKHGEFSYLISDMGQFYYLIVKPRTKRGLHFTIKFYDSYKLLPFGVEKIGKSFKTKHQKTSIEYEGVRFAGGIITEQEREYISNDVLVMKEAMEITLDSGAKKMTIGSCCLAEYKKLMGFDYKAYFPRCDHIPMPEGYGCDTLDQYCRRSYRGAWTYIEETKKGRIIKNGATYDVNSEYPYVMHSDSGNRYPLGLPFYWKGNEIPEEAKSEEFIFIVRVKTRFYLKEGYLPFIQLKNNLLYNGREHLKSSDIKNPKTGKYSDIIIDRGKVVDTRVEITFYESEYYLFLEHYNVVDFEILDGVYFHSEIGLFDEYINKYKEIKINSEGAKREIAKLYQNNLYGKLASSDKSSYKIAYEKEDNSGIGFYPIEAHEKSPVYIPAGSGITANARCYIIRMAQKHYKPNTDYGFCYCDTDSLHIAGDDIDLPIDKAKYGCFKKENEWSIAIFAAPKRYIEVNNIYADAIIKCAGMPEQSKKLLKAALCDLKSWEYARAEMLGFNEDDIVWLDTLSDKSKAWLDSQHNLSMQDFKVGLTVAGKLYSKRIKGGIILYEDDFVFRN